MEETFTQRSVEDIQYVIVDIATQLRGNQVASHPGVLGAETVGVKINLEMTINYVGHHLL